MVSRNSATHTEAQPNDKHRHKQESAVPPERISEHANANEITLATLGANGNEELQTAKLNHTRLQTIQRQKVVSQLGRIQGNRHLQSLVGRSEDKGRTNAVQLNPLVVGAELGLAAASFAASLVPAATGGLDYTDVITSRSRPDAPSIKNPKTIPILRLWAHIALGDSSATWNLTLDTDGDSILSANTGFGDIDGFNGGMLGSNGRVSWNATPLGGEYAQPTKIMLVCAGSLNPLSLGYCDFRASYIVSGDGKVTPRSCEVTNVSGNLTGTFNWKQWGPSGLSIENMDRDESERLNKERETTPPFAQTGPIKRGYGTEVLFKPKKHIIEEKGEKSVVDWYFGLPTQVKSQVEAGLVPITLRGHASTTQPGSANRKLAHRRVERIQSILQDIAGSTARFRTYAYGEYKASTPDQVESATERRVEIEVEVNAQ